MYPTELAKILTATNQGCTEPLVLRCDGCGLPGIQD